MEDKAKEKAKTSEFSLNNIDTNRFRTSIKKKHDKYGQFTISFTPTGIGTSIMVESLLDGTRKDITDYESW